MQQQQQQQQNGIVLTSEHCRALSKTKPDAALEDLGYRTQMYRNVAPVMINHFEK
jgi:hypothetical protein